jgi:tripartite-type tricarboxylate transporter receptor subunit TctC
VQLHRRPGGRQFVRHHGAPDRAILSDKLGQQFVVEARPGAAGNIATEFVRRARRDGYTLLLVNAQNTINAALYDKLNFDFLADIVRSAASTRAAGDGGQPVVPANTIPEFIAYAKANPGKLNMASAGIGGRSTRRRAVQVHGRRGHDARALSRLDAAVTDMISGRSR